MSRTLIVKGTGGNGILICDIGDLITPFTATFL